MLSQTCGRHFLTDLNALWGLCFTPGLLLLREEHIVKQTVSLHIQICSRVRRACTFFLSRWDIQIKIKKADTEKLLLSEKLWSIWAALVRLKYGTLWSIINCVLPHTMHFYMMPVGCENANLSFSLMPTSLTWETLSNLYFGLTVSVFNMQSGHSW